MRGGARLIKVQTNPDLGRKRRAADEIFFFDLKDSKRVKIND